MTIDEAIIESEENDLYQTAEWLRELKAYRSIIDTAEEKIKDTYGAVIVEGYADIFDQLKEIRRNNNDWTNIRKGKWNCKNLAKNK